MNLPVSLKKQLQQLIKHTQSIIYGKIHKHSQIKDTTQQTIELYLGNNNFEMVITK
jgi:hypothetical protein